MKKRLSSSEEKKLHVQHSKMICDYVEAGTLNDFVSQSYLVDFLCLSEEKKKSVTTLVKSLFPGVKVIRHRHGGQSMNSY